MRTRPVGTSITSGSKRSTSVVIASSGPEVTSVSTLIHYMGYHDCPTSTLLRNRHSGNAQVRRRSLRSQEMGSQTGQASVEWTALVLLVTAALGAGLNRAPGPDGRSFGGFLAHRLVCAVRAGCRDGDAALARAYGPRDARL